MVHFPEQTQGISIEQPENSLILHPMLEGMLRGTIANREQLAAWIAAWSGGVERTKNMSELEQKNKERE